MNEPEVFVGQPKSGKENLTPEVWIDELLTDAPEFPGDDGTYEKAMEWFNSLPGEDEEITHPLPGRHGSTPPSVVHGHFLALVREMSGPVFVGDTEFTGANRAARRRNSKVNKASYMRMLPGRF